MTQIVEMTHKQKVKMYKKLKKRELIEMLIAANEVIKAIPPTIVYNPTPITSPLPYKGWEVIYSSTNLNTV